MTYSKHLNDRNTPQSERLLGRPEMVRNNAGGFVFAVDDWTRLQRWLILGSEGGTFYQGERDLTVENAEVVLRLLAEDGARVVREVVEISESGRAVKNEPALLALALAASKGDVDTRRAAFAALPRVARIGTHLLHFLAYLRGLRGWGRMTRAAVREWLGAKSVDDAAYQMLKYASRDGWAMRDVLRLAHPRGVTGEREALYRFVLGRDFDAEQAPELVRGVLAVRAASSARDVAAAVARYRLPREVVPTEWLNERDVWAALLPHLGVEALARNLAKLTSVGLLAPGNRDEVRAVASRLTDAGALKRARMHPIKLLAALMVYSRGRGERGNLTWAPVQDIVDALDAAFYLAFDAVEPSGKRFVYGVDVSGSMWSAEIANIPGLTAAHAAATLALVTKAREPDVALMAFTASSSGKYGGQWGGGRPGFEPLNISPRMRLDDVMKEMQRLGQRMGGTDCALPMLWAREQSVQADVFAVITDNETWAGQIHPTQALRDYRAATGIGARLAVLACTPTPFSIADPTDAGTLDLVGFDTSTPNVLSQFAAGLL